VVVENVERLMEDKKMSPQDATREAMREITPAIIGITLVLTAVFIPMAFASGSVGIIYRQFSISMAISILLSAFLALTLTPALCATLLKPHGIHQGKSSVFSAWFNAHFHRLTSFYATGLGFVLKRTGRMMMIYAALCLALFAGLSTLPSSFLPDED
ncbi:efflux RND transporter permease subunit, partial [Klebsiella pneumoniae]